MDCPLVDGQEKPCRATSALPPHGLDGRVDDYRRGEVPRVLLVVPLVGQFGVRLAQPRVTAIHDIVKFAHVATSGDFDGFLSKGREFTTLPSLLEGQSRVRKGGNRYAEKAEHLKEIYLRLEECEGT